MKVRLLLLALCTSMMVMLFAGSDQTRSQTNQPAAGGLSQAEHDLLSEINAARAHPGTYASYLEKLKPLFNGKVYTPSGQEAYITQEGWNAVEEAIKFMRAAKPQGALNMSPGLCRAAATHVKDQSATGATGHRGTDSTLIEERVKPFGSWQGGIGENLAYGNAPARERILTWLIDDGFASRGHRMRIMSDNYRVAGVSCGPHPEFGAMCVLTLAGGFIESQSAKPVTNKNTNTSTNTKSKNTNSRKPSRSHSRSH
jgi:cysteine-rich secretory family protein